MKNAKIYLALIFAGFAALISARIIDSRNSLKKEFVQACSNYSLTRIQESCAAIDHVASFDQRKEQLTTNFTDYCTCLTDVWNSAGIHLRPDFFINARQPEATRTTETQKILAWIRNNSTKSAYARCHNRSGINVNWVAAAQLEFRNKQNAPKLPPKKNR